MVFLSSFASVIFSSLERLVGCFSNRGRKREKSIHDDFFFCHLFFPQPSIPACVTARFFRRKKPRTHTVWSGPKFASSFSVFPLTTAIRVLLLLLLFCDPCEQGHFKQEKNHNAKGVSVRRKVCPKNVRPGFDNQESLGPMANLPPPFVSLTTFFSSLFDMAAFYFRFCQEGKKPRWSTLLRLLFLFSSFAHRETVIQILPLPARIGVTTNQQQQQAAEAAVLCC